MTVAELIEALKAMPQDAEVTMDVCDDGSYGIDAVIGPDHDDAARETHNGRVILFSPTP